jgi:uncharacterized damage-inducible protein DinB
MQLPSSISTRLQYQHKSLVDLIDGFSDDQVRKKIIPGKWSIFENIVHLATYQHVFVARVRTILEMDNPGFERYVPDTDPLFIENCTRSTREIMQDFVTTRKEMAADTISFPDSDFEKKGTHPLFGEMTLTMWLHFFLLHEAHHLLTIFKLSAELRKMS